MVRRLLSVVVLLGGCWSEEPLVFDAFTPDQWARIQDMYKLPERKACTGDCIDRAVFGQQLFFEPALSGPWVKNSLGHRLYPVGKTSCATCHDPGVKTASWYVDTRADNAVSLGAEKQTKRNTITLVNVDYGKSIFTWAGECTRPDTKEKHDCTTPIDVVHDIALPKAMSSDGEIIRRAVMNNPAYRATYMQLFGTSPQYQHNVEVALEAYMRKLVSIDAPFDRFIAGRADAMEPAAIRGFALFLGRGMCVECHSGPFFTDETPHVTGVPNNHDDAGRAGTGAFYTPTLRHVAETGPYMHNGSVNTLGEVMLFYRDGGGWGDYVGHKDVLMEPLDLDDDELKDLEAFMRALTGAPPSMDLRQDTHSCVASTGNAGKVCRGVCVDTVTDVNNCGGCGRGCLANEVCMGTCYSLQCPPPTSACNHACVDFTTDPMNCGSCGHACPSSAPTCSGGTCQP